MKVLKQKISPFLAFAFVLIFGYLSIYLMNHIFNQYVQEQEGMKQMTEGRKTGS